MKKKQKKTRTTLWSLSVRMGADYTSAPQVKWNWRNWSEWNVLQMSAWGEILSCLWRPEGAAILKCVNGARYLEHIWFPHHRDALHIAQHLLYNKPRFMCAPISTSKMLIIQTKHARWICNTTIERRRLNYISSLSLMCAYTMFWIWIMLDGWIESIIIHSTKRGWHGQVYAAYCV